MMLEVSPSRVAGRAAVPGSKSHTIRGITAALLADGTSQLVSPLDSADTHSVLEAARRLGAGVTCRDGEWSITGTNGAFAAPGGVVDLGNSGTGLRMLTAAIAAAGQLPVTLDGDASLRTRVMAGEIAALTALGAKVESSGGLAPLTVLEPLRGGRARVDGTTSQFLTALLFALPFAPQDSELELEFLFEQDYVRMSLEWLKFLGLEAEYSADLLHYRIPGRQRCAAFRRVIPADFSTAAFPLAAALVAGAGEGVTIQHLDFNDVQGDKRVFEFAAAMQGVIDRGAEGVTVRRSPLRGSTFDLNRTPDALPVMAVLGAYAEGETRLVNVAQARLKECDRIAATAMELRKMGAQLEELPDGLVIRGGAPLHGADVDGHGDHRIVMALAVAALGAEGVTRIAGAEACGVTYPEFITHFRRLGADFTER